jgi:hypothetical protein
VSELDALDREIAELAANDDAAELDRLEARLALLGGAESATAERREMAKLLSTQADLLRRVHMRHEAAAAHRGQLVRLLDSLWGELSVLKRADAASSKPEDAATLRGLCAVARAGIATGEPIATEGESNPALPSIAAKPGA